MPRLPHPRTALSRYADARLPRWRWALVEHHLRGCTRCAVEVAQIRALGALLRAAPPVPEAPPDLVQRLLGLGDGPAPPQISPGGPHVGAPDRYGGSRAVRPPVGAAGVLVAVVVLLGTAGAGAAVTGAPVPWSSATVRASMSSVLPRLWSGEIEPGGAASVRPVDNGQRP